VVVRGREATEMGVRVVRGLDVDGRLRGRKRGDAPGEEEEGDRGGGPASRPGHDAVGRWQRPPAGGRD
jgi:hypothetical protein